MDMGNNGAYISNRQFILVALNLPRPFAAIRFKLAPALDALFPIQHFSLFPLVGQ
jgi:hypothetical protein